MNKIVASVGLVALGAASVHAESSGSPSKWWNVSATVQGFYDDNANTAPTGVPGFSPVHTFGYQLSPSIGIAVGDQQTSFTATYTFSYLYYEKPLSGTVVNGHLQNAPPQKSDMDHTFNLALDHAFNERYAIHLTDSFVIGQQPDTLRAGNALTSFQRIPGDNIVNAAGIVFNGQFTPLFGIEAGYNNDYYRYDADEIGDTLNRDENYAHLDARWTLSRNTVGVLGYQFGDVIYIPGSGPDAQLANPTPANPANTDTSRVRDTVSHTVYAGADHTFAPQFTGSLRAGASYYDYYNDPNDPNGFGPYGTGSLTYTYAPESTFSIGAQEGRIASSLTTTRSVVHDTESTTVYANLVHRIVPKLFGSVKGTFQNSIYHGGGDGINGRSDQFYEVEADLEYRFNGNFSVHGGYDYDKLVSGISVDKVLGGIPRDYDRNRFYIGATASY